MTTEWRDLPTMADVAAAQAAGDEIQANHTDRDTYWIEWVGVRWFAETRYRARPRQPKMKKVKSLCWRDESGDLTWTDEGIGFTTESGWQRFPAGDIEGEVEDD